MKCFGHFMHKAPEFSATGLSPCCLPGSGGSFGGGAHVNVNFTQGPSSSAIFRSCSASLGAWAAVFLCLSPVGACWELSIVEPCKPHLRSGTDHNSGSGIEGVGLEGSSEFRFSTRFCGLGCGRCRSNLEPLTAFFESAGCPKEVASKLAAASPKKPKAR